MRKFAIIGFMVGTAVAGCASSSGTRSEQTTNAAHTPNQQHEHGAGDRGKMMADMCPMQVPGTTVAATDVEGGIGLAFTTNRGKGDDLQQRVRRLAEMHNNQGNSGMMMREHGGPAPATGFEHQHGAGSGVGNEGGSKGGMMMKGGMIMPAATASVEYIESGARLILRPNDPAHLAALQEHVRVKALRMAGGECPMISLGDQSDANHEDHHAGN